jgi:hypothetical protein
MISVMVVKLSRARLLIHNESYSTPGNATGNTAGNGI